MGNCCWRREKKEICSISLLKKQNKRKKRNFLSLFQSAIAEHKKGRMEEGNLVLSYSCMVYYLSMGLSIMFPHSVHEPS